MVTVISKNKDVGLRLKDGTRIKFDKDKKYATQVENEDHIREIRSISGYDVIDKLPENPENKTANPKNTKGKKQ